MAPCWICEAPGKPLRSSSPFSEQRACSYDESERESFVHDHLLCGSTDKGTTRPVLGTARVGVRARADKVVPTRSRDPAPKARARIGAKSWPSSKGMR